MLNMNIDKKMFVEAHNKTTFLEALKSDTRIVIVNLQKFGSVRQMLTAEVLEKLARLRIAFLIDEIHRSHGGDQHEEMVTIFDELQTPFDTDAAYNRKRTKKNVIIGFTATPDDHTLARFGEFSGYAEGEKLWVPFDAYTMQEAIEDGYILNPLANIVPVAAKLLFDLPANRLKGFTEKDFKDIDKQQIYENRERIDAIAAYVADLLVKDVYRQIRGTAKAMLAVYSIDAAIAYKDAVTRHFQALVKQKKYAKYADAPIYIVYSDSQDKQKASKLNKDDRTEGAGELRPAQEWVDHRRRQAADRLRRKAAAHALSGQRGQRHQRDPDHLPRQPHHEKQSRLQDRRLLLRQRQRTEHQGRVRALLQRGRQRLRPLQRRPRARPALRRTEEGRHLRRVLSAFRRHLQGRSHARQPEQLSGAGGPHREVSSRRTPSARQTPRPKPPSISRSSTASNM